MLRYPQNDLEPIDQFLERATPLQRCNAFPGRLVPLMIFTLFLVSLFSLQPAVVAAPEENTMGVSCDQSGGMLHREGAVWLRFEFPRLGEALPVEVSVSDAGEGWHRVRMAWEIAEEIAQDELAIGFSFEIEPDFWWAPHLAPDEGDCIAQHVFRSPALIAARGADIVALIPDLAICGRVPENPWFLDVDAPARQWRLGMSRTEIPEHVRYRKVPGMTFAPGRVELGFYLTAYTDLDTPVNPWARVSRFLWERHARPLFAEGQPITTPMDRYVEHVYRWAFDTWRNAVWQEFKLGRKTVGAPAFIVNVTESPNYPGEVDLREFLSIWNQAWFSSLRGASGVFRYARRTGDEALRHKADLTKAFTLATPMKRGFFPSVYRTRMKRVKIGDDYYNRSLGWDTGYWTNSNRCPWNLGVTEDWYHVLDASWTALLMLRWHEELEPDPKLLRYTKRYANALLKLQDDKGFFPGWLDPKTRKPSPVLAQSPETSLSVTFLLKLSEITKKEPYRKAALRAMDAVLEEIVPEGRWEDFETYWSCNGFWRDRPGERIPRNAMYKQCNFSMWWTAEALLAAYRATQDPRYLAWGRRTLDELAMTQQVWQPPFIYIPALGGFGVMNFDAEWNDSRQCLFAETFLDYYRETGDPHYFERGIAALKAAFVMMYCPENPEVKVLWEKVWDFFGPEDYGFTMENYGHGGATSPEGEGMGNFTIYTWGNGAAAEARNRIYDNYGDVFIDRARGHGFGIDSIDVEPMGDGKYRLLDLAGSPRQIRVVFEDSSSRNMNFNGEAMLSTRE